MTDDEIRLLVREAIQRHLGGMPDPRPGQLAAGGAPVVLPVAQTLNLSFSRYKFHRAADDTMCLIEPAVRCNHCGYCECHGH